MKRISSYTTLFLFWVSFSIPIVNVITRSVSVISLLGWIASIVLFWKFISRGTISRKPTHYDVREVVTLLILCGVHIASLWAVGLNSNHFHRDEFIMAYTSYTLPAFFSIDWFAGYPDDWVAQYPILFHILQKPFLTLFGPSLGSIRFSIWPYCVGIIIYMYLLLKRVFSSQISSILVLLYIFWAPTLYFFSIGIHNASSTLFILGTLYHFTLLGRSDKRIHTVLSALYLACSFLTYTGSYIAIVIPAILIIQTTWRHRDTHTRTRILQALGITAVILAPFIMHALFVHNYFLDRFNAVNLYNGYWTNSMELRASGVPMLSILLESAITAFMSLFIPGIAGFGGYYFGFQALFTLLSISMFLIGVFALLSKKHSIHEPNAPYIIALVILTFIFGPATTIQPPAVHRLSVIFPIITIIMSYGLFFIYRAFSRLSKSFGKVFFGLVCLAFFYFNAIHFRDMMTHDIQDYPYTPELTNSLLSHVEPGSTLYIAGYFGFHLHKELFFRTHNSYAIQPGEWEYIQQIYNGEPLILVNPTEDAIVALSQSYPDYTIEFYGYEEYSGRILSEPSIFMYQPASAASESGDIIRP